MRGTWAKVGSKDGWREAGGAAARGILLTIWITAVLALLVLCGVRQASTDRAELADVARRHVVAQSCRRSFEDRPTAILEALAAGDETAFQNWLDIQTGVYRVERELNAELEKLHGRPARGWDELGYRCGMEATLRERFASGWPSYEPGPVTLTLAARKERGRI